MTASPVGRGRPRLLGVAGQGWAFIRQQALSCLFPGLIFVALALSRTVELPVSRYDFVLAVCLLGQAAMYLLKLETWDELKVIAVFHLLGLALELFKTQAGSWAYPEPGLSKLWGVPLYSGFMYASLASYLCQAWRRLKVSLMGWPGQGRALGLAGAVYLNFFSHHFLPDLRWPLTALVVWLFGRSSAVFEVQGVRRAMPLPLAFGLIALFVYLAENIATFYGAWQYPNQQLAWSPVHTSKISSWFLLVIVSFIVVAGLKHVKEGRRAVRPGG